MVALWTTPVTARCEEQSMLWARPLLFSAIVKSTWSPILTMEDKNSHPEHTFQRVRWNIVNVPGNFFYLA